MPGEQARGSHGASPVEDGVADPIPAAVVVVVVDEGAASAIPVVAVVAAGPGGDWTVNWDPVTTATSEPEATMAGS